MWSNSSGVLKRGTADKEKKIGFDIIEMLYFILYIIVSIVLKLSSLPIKIELAFWLNST